MATGFSLTYYSSIMALTFRFLVASFSSILPYSYCWPEWGVECLDDVKNPQQENSTVTGKSPAELYFLKEVLKEKSSIQDGIGVPEWNLVWCLLISWIIISIVLIKGKPLVLIVKKDMQQPPLQVSKAVVKHRIFWGSFHMSYW